MNVFDRIYALHKQLAGARHPVAKTTLEERLECSPATIKRIIRDMRLYLDAPIEYDRHYNGYYYAQTPDAHFELPACGSMPRNWCRCWRWINCSKPRARCRRPRRFIETNC